MKQAKLSGIFYAAFASLWWGVLGTLYFKFVSFATPIELTVHRTIWTAILLIITTGIFSKNAKSMFSNAWLKTTILLKLKLKRLLLKK